MRDVIWTIIVIWLLVRLVNLFKTNKQSATGNRQYETSNEQAASSHSEKEIKNAVRKGINEEGEYVDFEEIK
ncbi:MAG: hypothetical protein KF900_03130 [Bacteroidetes bacterium]|nr:hypothetical protein [Bacteroidota bacterium]